MVAGVAGSCRGSGCLVAIVCLFLWNPLISGASEPNEQSRRDAAVATLSHRSAKPGDRVELVVTVCGGNSPLIESLPVPQGIRIKKLRRPQLLHTENGGSGDVWLFRYRVTPVLIGDYEFQPIIVRDGSREMKTGPLFLHVSKRGELPPLSARELALGVNIPASLSEEVLKAAPQPTPVPEPTPTPPDNRPLRDRVLSSWWKQLKAFWDYPGK